MTDHFSLAHLSDPHLGTTLPRGVEWLGKRGLSGLSWRLRRARRHPAWVTRRLCADLAALAPDAIAVTGDLVNFGLAREFAAAADWLAGMGPPGRVVAIPGNHEAMVPGWRPGLAAAWGGYGDDGVRLHRLGGIGLIAVSTAIATPPLLACGRIGRAGRAALADRVGQARADGLCPVVLMHHPPTPITAWRKGLLDRAAVSAVLAGSGAALVLHGHTHRAELSWIPAPRGPIPVLGVPAFSHCPGGEATSGGWNLVTLGRAGGGWWATVTPRTITTAREMASRSPIRLALPG